LGGKPLLQWTVESALAARTLTSIVVTTEDEEIAAVAQACGANVPFLRPMDLARDDTPTLPVVQHALYALERDGERFDAVCLLQPTSPLRKASDIDACVDLFAESDADAVLSVLRVPPEYSPHWVYLRAPDGALMLSTGGVEPIVRRQILPAAFHRDGSVYVTKRDVIVYENSLYGKRVLGYETTRANAINIDTPADWDRAEAMIQDSRFASAGAA
jgi:CMP-N-acetylneuraminic acid synthetase